jgi:integrase
LWQPAASTAGALSPREGHPLNEIAVVDLATGMRRGELLALRLSDIDLDGATVRIERSLEETRDGLRFKAPKTVHGKRTISLPPNAVAVLREHRRKLLETRMAMGVGKPDADTLLFGEIDGSPRRPDQLSWLWRSACKSLKLPTVSIPRPKAHPCVSTDRGRDRCRRDQPASGTWEPGRHPSHLRSLVQARRQSLGRGY